MSVNDMSADAYDAEVERLAHGESVQAAVMFILRESRYVTEWFPPYSSGATDLIERWLASLREEWRRQDAPS
jgi:hypothetical protein